MKVSAEQIASITTTLETLQHAIPTAKEPTARDWSSFFKALVALFMELAPLILPLFLEPETD